VRRSSPCSHPLYFSLFFRRRWTRSRVPSFPLLAINIPPPPARQEIRHSGLNSRSTADLRSSVLYLKGYLSSPRSTLHRLLEEVPSSQFLNTSTSLPKDPQSSRTGLYVRSRPSSLTSPPPSYSLPQTTFFPSPPFSEHLPLHVRSAPPSAYGQTWSTRVDYSQPLGQVLLIRSHSSSFLGHEGPFRPLFDLLPLSRHREVRS